MRSTHHVRVNEIGQWEKKSLKLFLFFLSKGDK